MDSLHKWNLKIANFLSENEQVGHNFRRFKTFVMTQVDLYPRLTFLSFTFLIFLVIFNHPWILVITTASFYTGYHSIDYLQKNLSRIITKIFTKRDPSLVLRGRNDDVLDEGSSKFLDPLLNIHENHVQKSKKIVEENFKESQNNLEEKSTSPGKPHKIPGANSRLKINARLDKSIAHFCTLVFDAYITPDWAPYETRRQLKLAFVKLVTSFTEKVLDTFATPFPNSGEENSKFYGVNFCKEKIIPLVFMHIRKIRNLRGDEQPKLSAMKMKRALWKVRRLCRTLLEDHLSQDDQKCLLWMELCVAVLADGVIWNLILLGRAEIPPLVESIVHRKLINLKGSGDNLGSSTSQSKDPETNGMHVMNRAENLDETDCPKPKVDIRIQEPENIKESRNSIETKIPFLLDNFLDPSHDVEQAAMIVSRWRPTLNDILNERELLYALIQYLRGQKALEFLQAVLDDSPDGSEYCRKILELEYLPGFCRSRLFLESLDLNRVDEVGLEAGMETNTLKKPVGHTRSASYGAERDTLSGIKLWKIEQRVVDGIAIYNDKIPQGIPYDEPPITVDVSDSIFKRRHVLEAFLTKFYKSVNNFGKLVDPLSEPETARRLGIDFKDYEDFYHPDVLSNVVIEPCDALAETTNLVISNISKVEWLRWTASGWMRLLHPLLRPKFETFVENQIENLLNVDHFIQFVDIISEAFLQSFLTPEPSLSDQTGATSPGCNNPETCDNSSSKNPSLNLTKYIIAILENVFDIKDIISTLNKNGDEFILFCVDLLDILVAELCTSHSNSKTLNLSVSLHSTCSSDSEVLKT